MLALYGVARWDAGPKPATNMPDKATLQSNAGTRLEDAEVLFANQRYDSAAYLCGYAVEFALKARICETLDTEIYPDHIHGFKIHKLDILLFLTGRGKHIRQTALAEWTFVTQKWQPEMRYRAAGMMPSADVRKLLESIRTLLPLLL